MVSVYNAEQTGDFSVYIASEKLFSFNANLTVKIIDFGGSTISEF